MSSEMTRPRRSRIALAALVLLAVGVAANRILKACSDYAETVYVNTVHPDVTAIAPFAKGELGLLQPGFARSYLVVAYRQMAGLGLSDADQQGAMSLWASRAGIGPGGTWPGTGRGPGSPVPGPGRMLAHK